jgi:hypothetical protein
MGTDMKEIENPGENRFSIRVYLFLAVVEEL